MAAGIRGAMGIVSLLLISGSLVLLFFVILSGVKNTTPLNKTYFLEADTSSIDGARAVSRWTYFYICGAGNTDCGAPVPDLPLGYAWIGGQEGVPGALLGSLGKGTTSKYYYYMWRFGWVFYLLALIFDVFAFFTAALAPCSRLASGMAGLLISIALFWMSLGAALMTVTFVKMRNVFQANNIPASLGRYAFGFTWGAWAAMFLATILLFLGCGLGGRSETVSSKPAFSFRGNKRRGSVRRSFVENDSSSARRVKDEYA